MDVKLIKVTSNRYEIIKDNQRMELSEDELQELYRQIFMNRMNSR